MTKDENESFAAHRARRRVAHRGKSSEDTVHDLLKKWKTECVWFDFDRVYDTRSAGVFLPPSVADFTACCRGQSIALEVKEISKGHRLKKFDQLPRMLRRSRAGAKCWVVIHFLESGFWFVGDIGWFAIRDGAASWDFSQVTGGSKDLESLLKERLEI